MHRFRALPAAVAGLLAIGFAAWGMHGASAAASDVSMTTVLCDANPEVVTIRNFGTASVDLTGFHLQSDPVLEQDFNLAAEVAFILPGQSITFQAGPGTTDQPNDNTYSLTTAFIFRNGDPTDFARLVRSDSSVQEVACGASTSTPATTVTSTSTATATATSTATATPTATATGTAGTATATPTQTATPLATATATPTRTATPLPTATATSPAAPTATATRASATAVASATPGAPATGSGLGSTNAASNLAFAAGGALLVAGALAAASRKRRR